MILRQLEWLHDFRVINADMFLLPGTGTSRPPEFQSSDEIIDFKKGQKTKVEVMGDSHYRDIERNVNFTANHAAKFRELPFPLNPREAQFLALLDDRADTERRVSYRTVSDPDFVNQVRQIFGGPDDSTESFVAARAQELRDRGWIGNNIRDGYYAISERAESWSKKASS